MADAFYAALRDVLEQREMFVRELADIAGMPVLARHAKTRSSSITLDHAYKVGDALAVAPLVIVERVPDRKDGYIVTEGIDDFVNPCIGQNYNGIALRAFRGDASRASFSAEIGVPLATYTDLEYGTRPALEKVVAVWDKLGCDVEFLVSYDKLATRLSKQLRTAEYAPVSRELVKIAVAASPSPLRATKSKWPVLSVAPPQAYVLPQPVEKAPIPFDISSQEAVSYCSSRILRQLTQRAFYNGVHFGIEVNILQIEMQRID